MTEESLSQLLMWTMVEEGEKEEEKREERMMS